MVELMKTRRPVPWAWHPVIQCSDYALPAQPVLAEWNATAAAGFEWQASADEETFYLEGEWLLNPSATNYHDVNAFLWTGLGILRLNADVSGLSVKGVKSLMNSAFDQFYDAGQYTLNSLGSLGWPTVPYKLSYCPTFSVSTSDWGAYRNNVTTFVHAGYADDTEPVAESKESAPRSDSSKSTACSPERESAEFAALRKMRLLLEEEARFNRELQNEEIRDLVGE
jgi:hypothetical protein